MMETADSSETLVNLYLTIGRGLRRQFLQVNCSHSNYLSLKIVTLTFHCMLLQSELTAVKADRYRLKGQLVILGQANVEEKLRTIDQQSEEYIEWRDKTVVRGWQDANSRYKHWLQTVGQLAFSHLYISASWCMVVLMGDTDKMRSYMLHWQCVCILTLNVWQMSVAVSNTHSNTCQ